MRCRRAYTKKKLFLSNTKAQVINKKQIKYVLWNYILQFSLKGGIVSASDQKDLHIRLLLVKKILENVDFTFCNQ